MWAGGKSVVVMSCRARAMGRARAEARSQVRALGCDRAKGVLAHGVPGQHKAPVPIQTSLNERSDIRTGIGFQRLRHDRRGVPLGQADMVAPAAASTDRVTRAHPNIRQRSAYPAYMPPLASADPGNAARVRAKHRLRGWPCTRDYSEGLPNPAGRERPCNAGSSHQEIGLRVVQPMRF
jgi:hypothetical protein